MSEFRLEQAAVTAAALWFRMACLDPYTPLFLWVKPAQGTSAGVLMVSRAQPGKDYREVMELSPMRSERQIVQDIMQACQDQPLFPVEQK